MKHIENVFITLNETVSSLLTITLVRHHSILFDGGITKPHNHSFYIYGMVFILSSKNTSSLHVI